MSKTIKNNTVRNADTQIPVDVAFPNVQGPFFIDSVRTVYEYMNKERTEKILGYRYEVAAEKTRDTFDIVVEQDTPLVTDDDIQQLAAQNKDVRINIDMHKLYCRPKELSYGSTSYSFFCKGDAVSLLKNTSLTTSGTN